ncbi:MAG TPA: hypothetical protein VGF79_13345, partial [Bacteroidia bacterium]
MKEFLESSQYRPGSTAFTLFKKTFGSNLLVSILLGIVSFILFSIVCLVTLSSKFAEIISFSKKYTEAASQSTSQNELAEMISNFVMGFNPIVIIIINVVVILLYSMILTSVLKVNDNYVRRLETEPLKAIGSVFSKKYLHLALGSIAVWAVMTLVNQGFTVLLEQVIGKTGVVYYFVLFIFSIILIILYFRFSLIFPAIVHGNMNFIDGIVYSWKNITFKRGGMLLLLCLAMFIGLFLAMVVLILIASGISGVSSGFAFIFTILSIFLVYYGVFNYSASAMTTLYFRYSKEEAEIDESM